MPSTFALWAMRSLRSANLDFLNTSRRMPNGVFQLDTPRPIRGQEARLIGQTPSTELWGTRRHSVVFWPTDCLDSMSAAQRRRLRRHPCLDSRHDQALSDKYLLPRIPRSLENASDEADTRLFVRQSPPQSGGFFECDDMLISKNEAHTCLSESARLRGAPILRWRSMHVAWHVSDSRARSSQAYGRPMDRHGTYYEPRVRQLPREVDGLSEYETVGYPAQFKMSVVSSTCTNDRGTADAILPSLTGLVEYRRCKECRRFFSSR
ncbi:hypothetical protein LZ30DRAFT_83953 [Colletotrichum cereale]|nr:hypothetical protein LZ30DRAFT_83953 [Colletotrichum cereale]